MDHRYVKIFASGSKAPLKATPGHFATNHAHINYYLDMTTLKTRLSEAQEIAKHLAERFLFDKVVDTIVCLEGTQVIGAYLAEELKTIYVITPEYNSNSQMVFRENILPMVHGKNVVILTAVVTTGLSLNKSIEAIQYYGGKLQSAAAVFSTLDELNGCPITSVYSPADVTDYIYYDYRKCPLCEKGVKLDALVNAYGYTTLP